MAKLREDYLEEAKNYQLSYQVDALEQMFIDAYNERKEGKDLPAIHPRKIDRWALKGIHRKYNKELKRKAKKEAKNKA